MIGDWFVGFTFFVISVACQHDLDPYCRHLALYPNPTFNLRASIKVFSALALFKGAFPDFSSSDSKGAASLLCLETFTRTKGGLNRCLVLLCHFLIFLQICLN